MEALKNDTSEDGRRLEYGDDAPAVMSQELSLQLRIALIEQADVWQSLITGQQNLHSIGPLGEMIGTVGSRMRNSGNGGS